VEALTWHPLPARRRAVAFVFPAIIVAVAAYAAPRFSAVDLPAWTWMILALPALLAVVICVEFLRTGIAFDARGLRYRTVGYRLDAPWEALTLREAREGPVLVASGGDLRLRPWLAVMAGVLSVAMPARRAVALGLMGRVPLFWFLRDGEGPAMADLRARAPVPLSAG
jgi:hypothetical protein